MLSPKNAIPSTPTKANIRQAPQSSKNRSFQSATQERSLHQPFYQQPMPRKCRSKHTLLNS